MSLLTEVKSLLSTVSNVYIGSMPTTPDQCICLYNTGGYARDLSGTFVEEPTFQIKVRAATYSAGETLCNTVIDLLHGKTTTKIMMIQSQSAIIDIGRDENNRQEWTINFRSYLRR